MTENFTLSVNEPHLQLLSFQFTPLSPKCCQMILRDIASHDLDVTRQNDIAIKWLKFTWKFNSYCTVTSHVSPIVVRITILSRKSKVKTNFKLKSKVKAHFKLKSRVKVKYVV